MYKISFCDENREKGMHLQEVEILNRSVAL